MHQYADLLLEVIWSGAGADNSKEIQSSLDPSAFNDTEL
jgi:hypothetical protein